MTFVALAVLEKTLMSLLPIALVIAVVGLLLLIWSFFRIGGDIRSKKPIRFKLFLVLFVSLSMLDLLLCGYLFITSGLSHSSKEIALAPYKCLLSFILLVVCPIAAILLYRYTTILRIRESEGQLDDSTFGRSIKARIAVWSTVFAIICAIIVTFGFMGGWPVLMYTLRNDYNQAAQLLIHASININTKNRFGWTPIAYCASRGDRDTVLFLLDRGADVNRGEAILWAVIKRDIKLVELLLDHGADVNLQRNYKTSLMTASTPGNVKMVKLLLDREASINQKGAHGTALVCAAANRAPEVVELLIQEGADLNAKTASGETALIKAAGKGFVDVVKLLLDKGADIHAKNYRGVTALAIATERGHTQVRDLLIRNGASK